MKKIFGLAAFILFFCLSYNYAEALTISPIKFEFNAKGGDTIQDSLKVINETGQILNTMISSYNIEPDYLADDGSTKVTNDNAPNGLIQWIAIDKGAKEIGARGQYTVPFVINVPKDASPGGHYGVLCVGEIIKDDTEGILKPSVLGELCSLVLINVDGDIVVKGKIVEFYPNKEIVSSLPVEFITKFKNEGTVFLKPLGSIIIKNFFGREVSKIEFNELENNALPNGVRRFNTIWQKRDLNDKDSELIKEFKNFGLGPYTAELLITFGMQEKQSLISITKFWVFPWQLLLIVLIILIVLYFVIKQYNKGVVKRAMKKNQKTE